MAGVPGFVTELGWWAIYLFLCGVVFFRAQGTYWLGRWARKGTEATARSAHPRAARWAARFSGPGAERARKYLERWGYLGIPASFLTIGFQTMVNASAGFIRMRWDLYTIAMIPGCLAWAAIYTLVALSLFEAWQHSPMWLAVGAAALIALVAIAAIITRRRRSAGSGAQTPQ